MIGIFGSAFNPPTRGHLDAISQALIGCDEVWLVPSIAHAFGKSMLPFDTRLAMVKEFAAGIPDKRVRVCDIERDIWDGENPVYTIDVLSALQSRHPEEQFVFMVGPDNMKAIKQFKDSEELRSRWGVVSVADNTGIRSSAVRYGLCKGFRVSSMLTRGVERFITREGLYVR